MAAQPVNPAEHPAPLDLRSCSLVDLFDAFTVNRQVTLDGELFYLDGMERLPSHRIKLILYNVIISDKAVIRHYYSWQEDDETHNNIVRRLP